MTQDTAEILARLFATIESRKGADPKDSYTADLFAGGASLIVRKLTEEATEAAVEGLKGDGAALTRESADLIYHLMVLWAETGICPDDVWAELAQREGTSGLTEKENRAEKAARGTGEEKG